MQVRDGTIRMMFLIGALFVAVNWLFNRGAQWSEVSFWLDKAMYVICFVFGFMSARMVSRDTANVLTQFNREDAKTDRYRHNTLGKVASGMSAQMRAQSTISVLDAKRVDQIAQQRAELMAAQRNTNYMLPGPDDDGNDDDFIYVE